jgi:hypothetical protein
VAAHAIGDDEQATVTAGGDGKIVFVPGPDHPDVRPFSMKQTHH